MKQGKILKRISAVLCAAVISASAVTMSVSAAWVETSEGVRYTNSAGEYVKSTWINAKGGKKYFIKSNGYRAVGLTAVSKTDDDGKKVKAYYYFDQDGVMQTGWQRINGNYYYFRKNGEAVTGKKAKIGSYSYRFSEKGVWDGKVYAGKSDVTSKVSISKLTGITPDKDSFSPEFAELMKNYEEVADDYMELMDKLEKCDSGDDEFWEIFAKIMLVVIPRCSELDDQLNAMQDSLTRDEIDYYNDFYRSFESRLNVYDA